MTPAITLSIVLSLRNEESVLPELISRLQKTLASMTLSYELLFVNDASTDRTAAILEDYAGRFKEIKVLELSRRFGVQASILAGIQHAGGDAVIMMDADLQDPPELIPALVEKWRQGAEVVHTVRTGREGEAPLKMFLTKLAYSAISFLSEIPLPVEAGDFKLISRRAITELLRHNEEIPYLRGLITSLGFKQVFVPYIRQKRHGGASHFPLFGRGPVETFFSAVTSFSSYPLYFILLLGSGLSLLSLLIFLLLFLGSLLRGWDPAPWIANFFFLLLSLNLAALGIVGLYQWNILKQSQKRPHYIVERKVNF